MRSPGRDHRSRLQQRSTPCSNASGFYQQVMDYAHPLLLFPTRTEMRNRTLHPPCPIQVRLCSGDVEAIFARQQIGNHNNGNPRLALEKRFHDRRIEILFELDVVDGWLATGEDVDLCQMESGLFRRNCWMFERFFP